MGNKYTQKKIDKFPKEFYLDKQKDIKVIINKKNEDIQYEIFTPNHKDDNLLQTLQLATKGIYDNKAQKIIGSFKHNKNSMIYQLKLADNNIIELDSLNNELTIPKMLSVQKIMMAQKVSPELLALPTQDTESKITSDVHTHFTAMLEPEKLLALGLEHNVNYHLYYAYALGLDLDDNAIREILNNEKNPSIVKDNAENILEELNNAKGNIKKVNELFEKKYNKALKGLTIPLKDIVLTENSKDNVDKILASCTLPKDAQSTFTNMTKTYGYRFPFTSYPKDNSTYDLNVLNNGNIPEDVKKLYQQMCSDMQNENWSENTMQDDMILWTAKNAKEEGVKYLEMSHNALSDKNYAYSLTTYDKTIEKVEQETGTKIRFLAGISRSTKSKDFDKKAEYMKKSLKSKYVTGIDFLGEEFNSTTEFKSLLAEMTQYALDEDPDMVIRVHAGETNSYKDNIFKTLEIVYSEYAKRLEQSENPEKVPKPNLRIGHGIYGLDEEMKIIDKDSPLRPILEKIEKFGGFGDTSKPIDNMNLLDFMSEMDVVIERCMTSNVLLSHQNALNKDPIKEYLKAGVKCVLGTDGYGVYRDK